VFLGAPIEAWRHRPLIDTSIWKKEQEMALIIFLLIIGIPILELSVLIDVGGEIGALSTVALCLLTAAVGLSLVRMQGIRVFQDMQQQTNAGKPVGENLIHGFFLLISGVFLFIPGFVTDFFGAILLLPFVRLMLGRAGLAHMVVRSNISEGTFRHQHRSDHTENTKSNVTIEGEFASFEIQEKSDDIDDSEVIPPKKDADRN